MYLLTYLGSLHTQDWEIVIIKLQALSLVEKVGTVQVRFTLRLRDQWSMRLQDRCKVYMESYMASKWIMFHGHLDYFQKPPLQSRPNTKRGDHDTLYVHNRWFILFYHVGGPAWMKIHWSSIWSRARAHMASHYTRGSMTTLHDFGGVLGRFLLGSHNFMVTALGSSVKWP